MPDELKPQRVPLDLGAVESKPSNAPLEPEVVGEPKSLNPPPTPKAVEAKSSNVPPEPGIGESGPVDGSFGVHKSRERKTGPQTEHQRVLKGMATNRCAG